MDNLSLYEDSSLFGGDWTVGLVPTEVEAGPGQDDLKSIKFNTGEKAGDDLVQSLFTAMENHVDQDLSDPFGASWMDTKVDLMDLIMGEDSQEVQSIVNVQVPLFGQDSGLENLVPVAEEPSGFDVLKDMAEKTAEELEKSSSSSTIFDLEAIENNLSVDVDSPDWISPVLSPMSPDDIDSVLSSGPSSPALSMEGSTVDLAQMLDSFEKDSSSDQEYTPPPKKSRPSPYEKPSRSVSERKSRKKQQNKDAATRYRQKKKQESTSIHTECAALEQRNTELKEKVDQMTREIKYLKDLMADVFKRKGLITDEKRK